jgi:hypothetical protein
MCSVVLRSSILLFPTSSLSSSLFLQGLVESGIAILNAALSNADTWCSFEYI